ncbi:recombinase family protein [Streptomyces sp. S465]|uniref:recombinase family protein n=1 Tax=Streptomyces sp. S465 TaxID=2979468 RepID=UPI0022A81793|nr:recombinase family protein [Streptomyces sp. S465]WAP60944.1 recombinase family protein [Streptomyces sp. S465]
MVVDTVAGTWTVPPERAVLIPAATQHRVRMLGVSTRSLYIEPDTIPWWPATCTVVDVFNEKISTRIRVRPRFEEALKTAREIKAHAPHCRVLFTVFEMKRLGWDAAELTALADHLTAHGLVLEMLHGPLTGMYDPSGPGKLLFAFFAAMAETERGNIRESTLEGLDTAARNGKYGGAGRRSSPTTCSTPCSAAARSASPSSRSSPT